jgi:hypothetical protein
MASLATIPTPTEEYCVRELADEMVFLSLKGDRVHVLQGVGTFIWRSIDGQRSGRELLELILAEFEVAPAVAEAELLEFLTELSDKGLVALAENRN